MLTLSMLVKASDMRSISRITEVSITSVTKLLVLGGEACTAHHDETVRDVKAAQEGVGDVWAWTELDSDSKT